MSAAVLAPVKPAVDAGGEEELAHYTCCDETTAMCGTQLVGVEVPDDDPIDDCLLCVYVWDNHMPCPSTSCPTGGTP